MCVVWSESDVERQMPLRVLNRTSVIQHAAGNLAERQVLDLAVGRDGPKNAHNCTVVEQNIWKHPVGDET